MKKEREEEFLKLFANINDILPEISIKTMKKNEKVLLLTSSKEFYKQSTKAVLRILNDADEILSRFPDNPVVNRLDICFSQIKSLLIALALSKKDMFLKKI